ncbi:hypothetical protein LJC40_00130 [Synergistaceae bacterium OttesenSCG-928-D05]|nr:hypothetical protein [Synergistaceae bacterium OttesenSCG-928-D05]
MYKLRRELARALVRLFVQKGVIPLPSFVRRSIIRFWNKSNMLAETMRKHPMAGPGLDSRLDLLDLSCTAGYGQTVHPCARFVPAGFGAELWRYVLTVSGFPNSHDFFENPELLVSHDGLHWKVPDGGMSPLASPPMDWLGYHSDPFLFVENGKIYLIYRRFMDGDKQAVLLIMLQSSDGMIWKQPQVIFEKSEMADAEGLLMSPSLLRINTRYVMWYVDRISNGHYVIRRSESDDLRQWAETSEVAIEGLLDGEEPWHLEVVRLKEGEDELTMLLTVFSEEAPAVKSLMLMNSLDEGQTWKATGARLYPRDLSHPPESLYKSSILVEPNARARLYVSLKVQDGSWWTYTGEFSANTILARE